MVTRAKESSRLHTDIADQTTDARESYVGQERRVAAMVATGASLRKESKGKRASERSERHVATSQEGKGRDFRVTTVVHLLVAATFGPDEAKRTGTPFDEKASTPRIGTSIGHL